MKDANEISHYATLLSGMQYFICFYVERGREIYETNREKYNKMKSSFRIMVRGIIFSFNNMFSLYREL